MTADEIKVVREFGYRAGEIVALCELLGLHMASDPDTSKEGTAVEGLGRLAADLMNAVFKITEDE